MVNKNIGINKACDTDNRFRTIKEFLMTDGVIHALGTGGTLIYF